ASRCAMTATWHRTLEVIREHRSFRARLRRRELSPRPAWVRTRRRAAVARYRGGTRHGPAVGARSRTARPAPCRRALAGRPSARRAEARVTLPRGRILREAMGTEPAAFHSAANATVLRVGRKLDRAVAEAHERSERVLEAAMQRASGILAGAE